MIVVSFKGHTPVYEFRPLFNKQNIYIHNSLGPQDGDKFNRVRFDNYIGTYIIHLCSSTRINKNVK